MTQAAADEIRQLALMGGFVLCITKEDLLSVTKKEDFYDILARKWSELEKTIENDLGLLG
ncbi:hypothetical protein HNQ56_003265 [Anaerotaenia torta]|uniref:hypothetical protein n=1 Tax=Anaerotaenia torta TaxID=433293 RepID=UPI003D1CF643